VKQFVVGERWQIDLPRILKGQLDLHFLARR
jgi:hypothetical protein